jgi:hypothetical protein
LAIFVFPSIGFSSTAIPLPEMTFSKHFKRVDHFPKTLPEWPFGPWGKSPSAFQQPDRRSALAVFCLRASTQQVMRLLASASRPFRPLFDDKPAPVIPKSRDEAVDGCADGVIGQCWQFFRGVTGDGDVPRMSDASGIQDIGETALAAAEIRLTETAIF